MSDRQRAGREFEGVVANMFRQQHFTVDRKAGAAAPRQTDLFVRRSNDVVYLIEAKYHRRKATIDHVDSLFTRLEATPPEVIGILCSNSGFSDAVIDRVRERSKRPVLLLSGNELLAIADGREDLTRLLRRKKATLLTHREVELDRHSNRLTRKPSKRADLPVSHGLFRLPDGQQRDVLSSGGDFGPFVFAPSLLDIDWVAGGGVGVFAEIELDVGDEAALIALLHELADMGWITPKGRWSIQQATTNWHGSGAGILAREIRGWRRRYRGIDSLHHTEEATYFDVCDGGFYTLTCDLSASKERIVRHATLSFQLVGIPIDTSPLRHLCETFEVRHSVFFRPRETKSVEITHAGKIRDHSVSPVALVVQEDDENGEVWVRGIVVEQPGFIPPTVDGRRGDNWLGGHAGDSQYLICDLRSWHPLGHLIDNYELHYYETAWTSEAQLVHVVADWRGPIG
ncbi:restriction endonuclease [Kribbella pratensis]|uniref:Restriction endonuclease n=2 Tax=Kribbella pratensis TaxID=2512112 RepID=A0A4R8CIT6_9ACTN|nr:restriction endonuclease [Kribbella pratensis]